MKKLLFILPLSFAFASETMYEHDFATHNTRQKISFQPTKKHLDQNADAVSEPQIRHDSESNQGFLMNDKELLKYIEDPLFDMKDLVEVILIGWEDRKYYNDEELEFLTSSMKKVHKLLTKNHDDSIKKELAVAKKISELSETSHDLAILYEFKESRDTLKTIYEKNKEIKDIVNSMLQMVIKARKNRSK